MKQFLLLLLLLTNLSYSQEYSSTAQVKQIVVGADGLDKLGDYLIVNSGAKLSTENVGVIQVTAPNKGKVKAWAENIDRSEVVLEQVRTDTIPTWLLRSTGKVWVFTRATWVDPADPGVIQEKDQRYVLEVKPAPPLPPGPGPGPGPSPPPNPIPTPTPTPGNLPFPGDGLRVMIVYDLDTSGSYPLTQHSAIFSKTLRVYLSSICTKVDGLPQWRVLDDSSVGEDSQGIWLTALNRPRSKLPWILISNGKSAYEGPLPETEAAVKELIGRYAQ